MAITQYPSSSFGIGQTVTPVDGTFTVDCSSATDFYLDFNDSYFTTTPISSFVDSSTADFGSSTSGTLTLPAGMQSGDLVIVTVGSDNSQAALPSGWTQINATNTASEYQRTFYKVMGNTPDTSVGITGISTASVGVAMAFRNFQYNAHTVATSGTGMPDAPSITTTVDNAMVIAIGALDDDSITPTVPAGYSNLAFQASSATGQTVMMATKLVTTAGAENPAAFGGSGTDDWVGISIELIPDLSISSTISFTNIPNQIKDINIFTNTNDIIFGVDSIALSWDTDIKQVFGLPGSILSNESFIVNLFTYNGEAFSVNKSAPQKIQKIEYITSTQSWIAPADVSQVDVLICGGGGGGDNGGSGGAGSVDETVLAVTPGQSYTITIGAGGTGATSPTDGASSSFGSLFTVAGGGQGTATYSNSPGGFGGFGYESAGTSVYKIAGIGKYGNGGSDTGIGGLENSGTGGRGGASFTNGGSGICIIKYWSAY